MSITWLTDDYGVFEAPVNIGIIKISEDRYITVDTGIDNSAINKVIKSNEMKISGALITHHHADHIGGIHKLASIGIEDIYAPELELQLIHNTLLEPYILYGGHPSKLLKNRYLMAKSALNVKTLDQMPFDFIRSIKCAGHTLQHTAYQIETIVYAGDAVFTSQTIDKYKLLFASDPKSAAEGAKKLLEINFDYLIPAHGPVITGKKNGDFELTATIDHYTETRNKIVEIIGDRVSDNEVSVKIMNELDLKPSINKFGLNQYYLFTHTIKGYISNLIDDKIIEPIIENGNLVYNSI